METFSKVELIKIKKIIQDNQNKLSSLCGHHFDKEIEENNNLIKRVDMMLESIKKEER